MQDNQRLKNRDISIDALRGIAMFLMVAAHSAVFIGGEKSKEWNVLLFWGNTVCFTMFLFVFGVSLYYGTLSKETVDPWKRRRQLLEILIAYYLTAFFGLLTPLKEFFDWNLIRDTILFVHVPGYTEFILSFLAYSALASFMPGYFKRFAEKKQLLYGMFITYCLGLAGQIMMFQMHFKGAPEMIAALFFGGIEILRFSLFHYFPVFLLGIYYGKKLKETEDMVMTQRSLRKAFLITTIFSILLFITGLAAQIPFLTEFKRWPPSVLFLSTGMSFTFLMFWILRTERFRFFAKFFRHLGLNPLPVLVFHIAASRVLEYFKVPTSGNILYVTAGFIFLLWGWFAVKYLIDLLRKPFAKRVKNLNQLTS